VTLGIVIDEAKACLRTAVVKAAKPGALQNKRETGTAPEQSAVSVFPTSGLTRWL
jgi:hypothetical protein